MKILLIGGTGAMGVYLVDILEKKGHDVYVTSRSHRKSEKARIHYLQGDAHDVKFRDTILKEHYHAIVDFLIYDEDEFEEVVTEYLNATEQYVFLSSSRVYAENRESIREDSPRLLDICENENYLKTSEYALKKARQENVLLKSNKTNWTIIRPYITYSNERLQLGVLEKEHWLYRALQGKSIVFTKDMAEHMTTMTFGCNVAEAMSGLIGNSKAIGEVFHIAGSKPILWSRILEVYQSVLEKKQGRKVNIHMLENSSELAKVMSNYNQVYYDRMYDRVFDNTKIEDISSEKVIYVEPEEGLELCLREFIDKKYSFKNINIILEAYMDKVTGEHMKLRVLSNWKMRIKYAVARYTPYIKLRYKL